MRIHYDIPDDLHRAAKVAAAQQGITLKEFLIRALEREVDVQRKGRSGSGG